MHKQLRFGLAGFAISLSFCYKLNAGLEFSPHIFGTYISQSIRLSPTFRGFFFMIYFIYWLTTKLSPVKLSYE